MAQSTIQSDTFAPVAEDLERVIAVIAELSMNEIPKYPSDLTELDERLAHVMATPGKKIRPAITLLSSRLWGAAPDERAISMAVAVELLHIAALIHDDTVDDADVRRGIPTAGHLWGRNFAVLLGDYVFATSAKFVCATESVRLIRRFAETIAELSRGELHEMTNLWASHVSYEEYLARVYDKTASLFCTSAESGAVLGNADEKSIKALRDYGYYLGVAYQVRDDVLDYESTTVQLGKPTHQDLLAGKLTLPAILAAEEPGAADAIDQFFKVPESERAEMLDDVIHQIRLAGGVKRAEEATFAFIDTALERLQAAPSSECRDALADIANSVKSM